MNERVWIAQADTTPVQNPVPLKVVTVVKPGSEQAITIDLGFDQKTKVDLSAVANEKMTMVHVGTKLIVLFDNHSTVTIEPFFDSTGKPLANLDVNLGAGHDVTGDQFASLFPITEDQSVLPAAGGGGSPASGADFHNPTVDPLATGNPLPLLGPEELGNFQVNLPLGPQSNFVDTAPGITLTPADVDLNGHNIVDEAGIAGGGAQPAGSRAGDPSDQSNIAHGTFVLSDADGIADIKSLTINGTVIAIADLVTATAATPIVGSNGHGTLVITDYDPTTGIGHYTYTLNTSITESPAQNNGTDTITDGDSFTVIVTDNSNLSSNPATILIDIKDDVPSITVNQSVPTLTVDESFLTNGTTPDPGLGHTVDVKDFGSAFTVVAGADGGTVSYALTLVSGSSNLIDTATDQAVVLTQSGNTISGYVTGHEGDASYLVFTLSVDAASGSATLTQGRAVHELDTNNHNEGISLDNNLVTLTVTVTDGDGDVTSKALDLGSRVTFHDDGPVLLANASTTAIVDEDNIFDFLSQGSSPHFPSETNILGAAYTTGSLSGLVDFGADGNGGFSFVTGADRTTALASLNALGLSSHGDALTFSISNLTGDLIATAGSGSSFRVVLDLHLSSNGDYLVQLFDQVDHSKTAGENETLQEHGQNTQVDSIDFGQIIQATDGDGDHVSLDGVFNVKIIDDIPHVSLSTNPLVYVGIDESAGSQDGPVILGVPVPPNDTTDGPVLSIFATLESNHAGIDLGNDTDIAHAATGSPAIAYAHGSLPVVTAGIIPGADGVASVVYSLQVASGGVYSGVQTTAGQKIYLFEDSATGLIVGRVGDSHDNADANGTIAFAIAIEQTGDIDIAQYLSLKEFNTNSNNETVSLADGAIQAKVIVTDGDGDTASDTTNIGSHILFYDDGPSVSVAAASDTNVLLTTHDANTIGNAYDTAVSTADFSGVFSYTPIYGADGPGTTTTKSYTLDVTGHVSHGRVDSGLDSHGNSIYLYENSQGVIIGSTAMSFSGIDSGNTVFTVSVDSSGKVTLTQYDSIDHTDNHDTQSPYDDQFAVLSNNLISLKETVTITDGDGDRATDSAKIDLGGNIRFADTGPSATPSVAASLDDEALTGGNSGTSNVGDLGGVNLYTTSGNLSFNAGADGLKSLQIIGMTVTNSANADAGALKVIHVDPVTQAATVESVTLHWDAASNTYYGTSTDYPDLAHAAFTLKITDPQTGAYTLTINAPLDHPFIDSDFNNNPGGTEWEDNLTLKFTYQVTDGDNDTTTSTLSVTVNDDSPTLGAIQSITVSDNAIHTGTIAFSAGADGVGTGILSGTPPANLTSGGHDVHYWVSADGHTLIGYTGNVITDNTTPPAAGSQVFTLTLDANDQGYSYQQIQEFDGTQITPLSIGGAAFGTGPHNYVTLTTDAGGSGTPIAIASGWTATSGFDKAAWQDGTAVDAAHIGIQAGEIKGSANGLGIGNQNFNTGEFMRFDFGTITDIDGSGGYTPPAGPVASPVSVTFDFVHAGSSDHVSYVVHYSDGTHSSVAQIADPTADLTITAPAGATIDYVEFYSDSTQGSFQIDLTKVSTATTIPASDLNFHVTLTDGDGDAVGGDFTVTAQNNTPPTIDVHPTDPTNGHNLVNEAGLPVIGSDAASDSEIAHGTIHLFDADGASTIQSLTVSLGGSSEQVNIADITGGNSHVFDFTSGNAHGTLTITNYDSSTGNANYTYELTKPVDEATTNNGPDVVTDGDSFVLKVTDSSGATGNATLNIDIQDDVSAAKADERTLAASVSSVTGNVLTDDVGGDHADIFGADGATTTVPAGGVVGVAVTTGNLDDSGTLGVGLHGQYGTLTLKADGSYTYQRDAGSAGGVDDVFTYTIKDGDGDLSNTTLTIHIADSTPVVGAVPAVGTGHTEVDEAGLPVRGTPPNTEPAGSNEHNPTTASGDISFTSQDGVSSVKLGGTPISNDAGNPTVIPDGTRGELSAYYTYNSASGTGSIHYEYKLLDNDTTGGNPTVDYVIVVSDADATPDSSASKTLTITIIDDQPAAFSDTDSVGTGTIAEGNVITGEGTTTPDDPGHPHRGIDTQGADGAHVSAVSSDSNHTATGTDTDATGGFNVTGAHGVLHVDVDGTYTYTRTDAAGGTDSFTYTLTDGDGDTSAAKLTITLDATAQLFVGSNDGDVSSSSSTHEVDVTTNVKGVITGSAGDDTIAGDPGGTTVIQAGATANIVFVLDVSASMSTGIQGSTDRMTAMQAALKAALVTLSNSGADNIRVHLVAFGLEATDLGTFDVRLNGVAQNLTAVNNKIDTLDNIETSGTNYEDGLAKAAAWINSTPDTTSGPMSSANVNKVLFISDGEPNTWDTNAAYTTHNNPSSQNFNQTALDNVTGAADGTDERAMITNSTATWDNAHPFTIEAIGINLSNSTALAHLSVVEGTGGQATNVTTAQGLVDAVGTLATSTTAPTAAGGDTVNGGAGNDIVYGDVMNTDILRVAASLTTLQNGSGWAVFAELEAGHSSVYPNWTRADTLAYIAAHKSELAVEADRSGGNDTITGGTGDDIIFAQEGNDTINYAQGDGHDIVDGGSGSDTLHITGATGIVTIAAAATGDPDNIVPATGTDHTDIIVTMSDNGTIRMDNVEDIDITAGPGGVTVQYVGSLANTALDTSTVTVHGGTGDDILDLTARSNSDPHKVIADGGSQVSADTVKLDFSVSEITAIEAIAGGVKITHAGGSGTVTDEFTNFENFYFEGDNTAHDLNYVRNIDLTPPTVSLVSYGTNDGALALGETVTLTVKFSEAVFVNLTGGSPVLNLNSSATASYVGGTGTDTLTFTYTPGVTQASADLGLLTPAFSLNGATIKDAAGNTAILTDANGVNPAGTLLVDTVAPTVVSIDTQNPSGSTTNADSLTFRVTFSEAMSGVDANDFTVSGTTTTISSVVAVAGSGNKQFDVTISGGGDLASLNGPVSLTFAGSQNATDTAGNALASTTPTGTDHHTYTVDNIAPSDIVFAGNADLTYTLRNNGAEISGNQLLFSMSTPDTAGAVFGLTAMTELALMGAANISADADGINYNRNSSANNVYHFSNISVTATDAAGNVHNELVDLWLGSGNDDTMNGSAVTHDQVMYGFGGNDTITGGSGNDWISGGGIAITTNRTSTVETLSGGAGNDTILYESGAAHTSGGSTYTNSVVIDGGIGNDTLVITGSSGLPTVNLSQANDQTTNTDYATVKNFENVDASGATAAISITGDSGANILIGGTKGDTLIGGGGADTLTGGAGADHFKFTSATANVGTHITDFSVADGDVIDLLGSAFGNPSNAAGVLNNSAFSQSGSSTGSTPIHFDTTNSTLYYNGTAVAVLDHITTLSASNIHIV